ncbi:hypothetical protein OIU74_027224 [Salix koriyanagi]|uniref:Uncharacterized protein n=1 Tax=Salix koriyanagi TaxID=2511006 RepID=A0A9Q0W2J7_9ROSI|nr:hypothetical protein OIU74_027224 [Salix koriyanagi]
MDNGLLLPVLYKKVKGAPCSSTEDQLWKEENACSSKIKDTQFLALEKDVKPDDKLTNNFCMEIPAMVHVLKQSFEARQLPQKKISGFHRENSDDASFRTLGVMLTKK